MKKAILPIAASLIYLLSSCNTDIEKIGSDVHNREYKAVPSTALVEEAKQDKNNMYSNIQDFRNSARRSFMTDNISQDETYLNNAIENLDDFVSKLSEIGIRYDSLEYQPSQKENLESNLTTANNEIANVSLDAFLQGAENNSELHFIALEAGKDYNTVNGTVVKESSGKDNGGNYAILSTYANGTEVAKNVKVYLDNQDTKIDGLYGPLIDQKSN